MPNRPDTDALIIGAGVAGTLLACGLARKGLRVLLVEAGPEINRAEAVRRFQTAYPKVPECAYPLSAFSPHPTTDKIDDFYVQKGPDLFRSTYLKQVGGTTWHWLGTAVRLVPDDFVLQSKFGRGVDWPVGYAALEPWYAAAERELGVSGDSTDDLGSPRSGPYPLPLLAQSYLDQFWIKALAGSQYRVSATPQARLSRPEEGRPACCGSASCIPICPVQAKYDASIHAARARSLGVQLRSQTVVTRIEIGDDRLAKAVHYRCPDGSSGRISARCIVVAANAIETPRLLLSSATDQSPAGVANSSDQVGRNLMDHPVQLSWALARDPVFPYRGPGSTSGIEGPRAVQSRNLRSALRLEIGNDGWSWPTGAPLDTARRFSLEGLRGAVLEQALREQASRHLRIAALSEQLPDPDNRITLDPLLRDGSGMARPAIHYHIDAYTRQGLDAARGIHTELFQRLGATDIQHFQTAQGAGHILGTACMGNDPAHSVVDANLRSHDHANLFLVGGAVFPTGGTGNPTLTIAALALRATDAIAATAAA